MTELRGSSVVSAAGSKFALWRSSVTAPSKKGALKRRIENWLRQNSPPLEKATNLGQRRRTNEGFRSPGNHCAIVLYSLSDLGGLQAPRVFSISHNPSRFEGPQLAMSINPATRTVRYALPKVRWLELSLIYLTDHCIEGL